MLSVDRCYEKGLRKLQVQKSSKLITDGGTTLPEECNLTSCLRNKGFMMDELSKKIALGVIQLDEIVEQTKMYDWIRL